MEEVNEAAEEATVESVLNGYEPVWVSLPVAKFDDEHGVFIDAATIDIGGGNLVGIVDLPTKQPNTELLLAGGHRLYTSLGRSEILDQVDRILRPHEYISEEVDTDGEVDQ